MYTPRQPAQRPKPSPDSSQRQGVRRGPPPTGIEFVDHANWDPVQLQGNPDKSDSTEIHRFAAEGLTGPSTTYPHLAEIQRGFGQRGAQLGQLTAHIGGPAKAASRALGAVAYTHGTSVAFAAAPDLHTAAHEAAHVVQQRDGVNLKGGVGAAGDAYERHADMVADTIVAGRSAEALLARANVSRNHDAPAVQRKEGKKLVSNEHFDTGPQPIGHYRLIPLERIDYSQPIPGTTEKAAEDQDKKKIWVISSEDAFVVITYQVTTMSEDTDDVIPSYYWIDANGNTGDDSKSNVDNIQSGWPRTKPFPGEVTHIARWADIHSCIRNCKGAPPRVPINKLTQHQLDYLAEGGVKLGPPGPDKVRRPLLDSNGHLILRTQLRFPDGTSPNANEFNERVRNSTNSSAFPGQSVITVNADTSGTSFGISGDSQGKYNAEGSPPQVRAAGTSKHGFISVFLHASSGLTNTKGTIQVPREEFTQTTIDAKVGEQYSQWLGTGGLHIIRRARVLAGLSR